MSEVKLKAEWWDNRKPISPVFFKLLIATPTAPEKYFGNEGGGVDQCAWPVQISLSLMLLFTPQQETQSTHMEDSPTVVSRSAHWFHPARLAFLSLKCSHLKSHNARPLIVVPDCRLKPWPSVCTNYVVWGMAVRFPNCIMETDNTSFLPSVDKWGELWPRVPAVPQLKCGICARAQSWTKSSGCLPRASATESPALYVFIGLPWTFLKW